MKILLIIPFLLLSLVTQAQHTSKKDVSQYKPYQDSARALLLRGKYKKAVAKFDTSLSIMPYNSGAYYERGYCHMQLGNYSKALLDFSTVIERADYKYQAYIGRAMAKYQLNDFYGARNDLEHALKLNPEDKEAKRYKTLVDGAIAELERQNNAITMKRIQQQQMQEQRDRYARRRNLEGLVWGTIIPMAFWTTIFLTW